MASTAAYKSVANSFAVADPDAPSHVIKPNSDGSLNIAGTITAAPGILVYTPLGYQQIVGIAAATTLTVPGGAKYAAITVSGGPIMWRDDGVNPTTTVGMPLGQDATLTYSGSLAVIAFIQVSATATLNISYYK